MRKIHLFAILAVIVATIYLMYVPKGEKTDPGPVRFTSYEETGEWKTFENEYFKLRIPAQWRVAADSETKNGNIPEHILLDDTADTVFRITIYSRGGFSHCKCAPMECYQYSEIDGCEIWSFEYGVGKYGIHKTIKAGKELYGTDIHLTYSEEDKDKIFYIAESVRPVK